MTRPALSLTLQTCPKCKGSGEELDAGKALMGVVSFGASMLVDSMLGDDVVTQACRVCNGRGQIAHTLRFSDGGAS